MEETINLVKEAYSSDHDANAVDVLHITLMTFNATKEKQIISLNYADLTAGEQGTIDDLKALIQSKLNATL